MTQPTALLAFIPGGVDFAKSRELFRTLGFAETFDAGDYVGMVWGGAKFVLQNFNDKHFAENLMMKLEVRDRVGAVVLAYETGVVTPGA